MSEFRKGRAYVLAVAAFLLGAVLLLGCQPAQPVATPKPAEKAAATPTKAAEKAAATPSKPVEKPVRGGTLRYAYRFEPASLDPHVITGYDQTFALYDQLVQPDLDWNVTKEGLFKDWTVSGDGKAVTFKLREGVKFHDGTDLDAAAVKWNIERMKDPATKSNYRSVYVGVGAVEVVDSTAVRFQLNRPDPLLLPSMTTQGASMMISPAAVKKYGPDYARNPMGSGPFQFVEWAQGDHVTVKRFEGYWGKDKEGNKLPYLDRLVFQIIPDPAVAVANVRSGQAEVYHDWPADQLSILKGDPNLAYTSKQKALIQAFILNTKRPPLDNKALRQAMALAMDREGMAVSLGEGGAIAHASLFHPLMWGSDPKIGVFPARDLAKAKAKMAEAGYPSGGPKINLLIQSGTDRVRMSEVAKANLAEIGIDLQLEVLAQAAYQARAGVVGGDMLMATGYTALGPMDPGYVFNIMFHSQGSRNYFGPYSNPQVDQLVDKAGSTYDQKERTALYQEAAKIVVDEVPLIPTFVLNEIVARNKKVVNLAHDLDGRRRFKGVWLAQ